MATFTNFATLSYNGGTLNSNTVTGEILETLSVSKTSVLNNYSSGDDVTYIVSLLNSGTVPLTGLTVTDDLGGYSLNATTVYPLEYAAGSVRYYVNGILQASPAVTAGPPLVISGISVPAGGNAMLIYEAEVTEYAPLAVDSAITNTAVISGSGLSTPISAQETVAAQEKADLAITKAVSPAVITENGQLTYTFVIENYGNTPAQATDNVVVTDNFDPILSNISVTLNGVPWTEGVNYTYNETTGLFTTVIGQITVPAATYTQNTGGTWSVTPGTAVLVVTGTI